MKNINWDIELIDEKEATKKIDIETHKYYDAIESLKRIKQKFINNCDDDFDQNMEKAIDLAIIIINRFIPKKPIMLELTGDGLTGKGFYQVNCPNCGEKIGYDNPVFDFPISRCNKCGQTVKIVK